MGACIHVYTYIYMQSGPVIANFTHPFSSTSERNTWKENFSNIIYEFITNSCGWIM